MFKRYAKSIVTLFFLWGGLAVLALVPVAWLLLYFGIYIGYGNYQVRGHQEFAANGVAQIEPALQMDRMFDDCRHYITYAGSGPISIWNTVAYFGGRYELSMQVQVEIESSTNGRMIGQPQFFLNEVDSVSVSSGGQVSVSYSKSQNFRHADWQAVVAADGDFGVIGFPIQSGPPVKNFDVFAKASR